MSATKLSIIFNTSITYTKNGDTLLLFTEYYRLLAETLRNKNSLTSYLKQGSEKSSFQLHK